MMFKTARQNRIFQDVVEQIQEAILTGRLKTGDTLPPERELKEMFKTSRGTLREALRVLEQKGLIEIKLGVGGGSVVKDVSIDQITENLALLIRSQQISLIHLAEFREGIEGSVAALAAQRATRPDIEELKKLLQEAAANISPPDSSQQSSFLRVDKKIHMALARISGNPVYIFVLKSIHDNIHKYYDRFLFMADRELEENYTDLARIVAAVENSDSRTACRIAQAHVHRFNRKMMAKERQR